MRESQDANVREPDPWPVLSVTASMPGTSGDNAEMTVEGIVLRRRYRWRTYIDFSWGTA